MSDDAEGAVCIPNIGPKQRRLRMLGGIVSLAIAVIALALLETFGFFRWTRVILVLPLWSAALAVLQAREKT